MSSVFKARDTLLERHVALKILHPHFTEDEQYVERFRREARAVASLSHPNIVTILDRGEDEGRQFIVFELVEGQTLKEILDEEGRLPLRRALELAIQVARGLAFAHEHGLVHRDVKPQNVILNGDGRAKVTDFGIARSRDIQGVTQTGMVLGTSNYVAPEQAQGGTVDRGEPLLPATHRRRWLPLALVGLGVALLALVVAVVVLSSNGSRHHENRGSKPAAPAKPIR